MLLREHSSSTIPISVAKKEQLFQILPFLFFRYFRMTTTALRQNLCNTPKKDDQSLQMNSFMLIRIPIAPRPRRLVGSLWVKFPMINNQRTGSKPVPHYYGCCRFCCRFFFLFVRWLPYQWWWNQSSSPALLMINPVRSDSAGEGKGEIRRDQEAPPLIFMGAPPEPVWTGARYHPSLGTCYLWPRLWMGMTHR